MKTLLASVATLSLMTGTAGLAYADHHMEHEGHKMESMDIVETAAANDDFSTLVTAVTEAGLVEALQGDGPFTVFAPTNEAFAALPEGTLDTLLMDENIEQLQGILKLHVVSGDIMATDIPDGAMDVETLSGDMIEVVKSDAGVTVGGANVVMTDIKTSNGVIHVIDSVILPQ